MKKLALFSIIALAALSFAQAADPVKADAPTAAPAAAPTKIEGEATCAKCDLGTADKCQNAITVTGADGKKEVILCDANDVSKNFHGTVCKAPAKVTAEGVVTEKDGKKTVALTKITVAK